MQYIEDIYFFEVNTKYISSSVLKTSEFSRVRSTGENADVFNSRDEICLVFTEKSKFSFYFILFRRFTVNRVTVLRTKRQRTVMTDSLKKKKIIQHHNFRQVTS